MSLPDLHMRDTRAGARPSTAPIGLLSNLQWEGGEDELIAVRIEGSELLLPRSSFPPPAVEDEVLPAVARAPGTFHSCDRFVDECIPPVSVPRAFGVPVSATMQFEEIHKMFHDLIVSLFYGDDAGESELPAYKQKERQRQRRARRNNTRLIYLLENIIPLVSQGLTELTHALVHRQKHLSKILPQCFVENGASAYSETVISNVTDDDDDEIAGLSGESLIQPPGGALVWLARYMIRHNPTRPQSLLCAVSKDSAKDIRIARKQRQYAAILAKCLREYDNWQTCKAQHDALKQVELRHIWDAIDTNDDGTLDISEVGKALVQLGFRLSDEDGSVTAEDDMKEEFWALELAEIEQLFSALDVDGSGDVDFDEFVLGTSRWFYGRQMMARAVFDRKMDSHHLEHSSDMAELLQSLARQRMIRSIQAASLDSAKLFSKIDKENSGFVNYDAFHKGILELASVMSGKSVANGSGNGDAATGEGNTTTSSAKHIVMVLSRNSKRLFAEIDTDGDGLISLEEFQRFFVGYIDSSIEEKARQAAHRIEIEQEDHIRALVNQGHVTLRCADRALAAQQLRLDTLQRGARTVKDNGSSSGGKQEESKTDADRLAELRESIGRLQIELGQDSVDENALAVLQEARAYLGGCMEAVQAAERLCNMAASDIDSAHEAITAALNQATSATRLADLQGAVGELSVTDHRRSSFNSLSPRLKRESASLSNMTHYEDGNLTIVEASDKSIKTLTKAVSMAEEIIAGSSQTLMNLKNAIAGAALRRQQMSQRRAIDDRRNKRRENERRKAEEAVQRHRIEAAEKSYEAMRKRKLGQKNKKDEALRQEQEESDAAIEEAREREREAAERERILRAEAANAAEERRAVRREIRRVEFTKQREEEEKAREEKYREEEAGREAQKIIESFQPDNSVFKARGKGAHAAFFDSDKTCREAVELELERALAKKSVESLINHPNQEHVKEVKIALLGTDLYSGATARAILDVYRHYCLSGHHMFSMQKFGFDQFTQESGIADPISPTCSPHHLETTFITSNLDTKPKWRSAAHSYNRRPDRSLNRAEFIEALIRIGIQKYYADDENPDQAASTGEAVSLLMTHHITNFVHGHGHSNRAILNPDDFRKRALYSHSVDAVLRQGDTLAFLEETYQMNCEAEEGGRISVQAWLRFVRKNASLGGSNPSVKIGFSEEFAKECFIQSRLIVVDEEAPSAALRVRTLSFEDFLEAVVRLTGGVNIEGQVGVALDDPDAVAQRLEALIAVVMAQ